MRAKTEHSRSALYDLEPFSLADKLSFFVERDWVADDPLRRTQPTADPSLSGYGLRFFDFGVGVAKIAIVLFDPARNLMRILRCRPARPRREPRKADGSPVPAVGR